MRCPTCKVEMNLENERFICPSCLGEFFPRRYFEDDVDMKAWRLSMTLYVKAMRDPTAVDKIDRKIARLAGL